MYSNIPLGLLKGFKIMVTYFDRLYMYRVVIEQYCRARLFGISVDCPCKSHLPFERLVIVRTVIPHWGRMVQARY
jgi:hypothetical protein